MSYFQEFSYTSSTGVNTVYALKCVPDFMPKAVVQIAHGVGDHINRYREFMTFLADSGFVAVGNDHLGHGRSIRHPIEQGFFAYEKGWQHVVNDMDILHGMMKEQYPHIPYIFFGHSMGSFLTRTYLIDNPDCYDAAIISGTGHMQSAMIKGGAASAAAIIKTRGPRHASSLLNSIAFGSYNKCFKPVRTVFDWISRDTEQVDKYIDDPCCGFIPSASLFKDMSDGLGYITAPENISRMNKSRPILFISGDMDPVGENGKGVERAYKAFCDAGLKDVYMKLYPGGRHEMLNEINRQEVYKDIADWINSKT